MAPPFGRPRLIPPDWETQPKWVEITYRVEVCSLGPVAAHFGTVAVIHKKDNAARLAGGTDRGILRPIQRFPPRQRHGPAVDTKIVQHIDHQDRRGGRRHGQTGPSWRRAENMSGAMAASRQWYG